MRLFSRELTVAAIVVAAALGAVGFLPLFGGPGYEHAVASGVVAPSAAAVSTALFLSRVRVRDLTPLAATARGVAHGLVLALVALGTALAHAARIGACDLAGGVVHFALTAGVGAVLGGLWGAVAGELARRVKRGRRALAILAALAGPLGGIVVSVGRFYGSPMIFAFDPFFGYFSGTLYDTVVEAGTALLTYRLASAATIAGALLAASSLARTARGRLCVARSGRVRFASGALLLATSAFAAMRGPALDHWQTASTIARELGGSIAGARCTVLFPSGHRPDEAALFLKDCEEQLAAVEATLGVRGPERVTEFLFRDAGEKRRLMGAADTYIAKPWRAEVYVQISAYPHPVLGHELAHLVAGSVGQGPFRIAGALGGLWPNPGLIEGIAVAASPDDDELTDMQWARAMMDVGILPPIASVFSMDFLGSHASKSYTVAGAFVTYVLERHGAAAVRAWYGGLPIATATGASFAEHDRAFRAHLATVPFPDAAKAYAAAKFERKGVFARRCPHVVDALRRDADGCRDARQAERAIALYDAALARDPGDLASRYGRALTAARQSDPPGGRAALLAMADGADVPQTWRDRASETLADLDAIDGATEAAAARYAAIAARSIDEDVARTLEVKARAVATPEGRAAIEALLLGTKERPGDVAVAFLRLGTWTEREGHDPLADYLLGKNLAQRGALAEAVRHLDRALAAPAPSPRIGRETFRMRAIVACEQGDRATVAALDARARAHAVDGPFAESAGGRRDSALRLLARCAAR